MTGWHHRLDGHEFEWTLGVGEEQGGLECCNSWGRKESDTTERLKWTEWEHILSQRSRCFFSLKRELENGFSKSTDSKQCWLCGHIGFVAKLLQSCMTLCDPMDCSPPTSSEHEILQTRILEWVAMLSSKGASQPRDWTLHLLLHWQVGSLALVPRPVMDKIWILRKVHI